MLLFEHNICKVTTLKVQSKGRYFILQKTILKDYKKEYANQ